MGIDTRFGLTLGIALLVWAPAAIGLFNQSVSFTAALVRFAIALVLSFIGVTIVNKIIVNYGTENAVRQIQEAERRSHEGEIDLDLDR